MAVTEVLWANGDQMLWADGTTEVWWYGSFVESGAEAMDGVCIGACIGTEQDVASAPDKNPFSGT